MSDFHSVFIFLFVLSIPFIGENLGKIGRKKFFVAKNRQGVYPQTRKNSHVFKGRQIIYCWKGIEETNAEPFSKLKSGPI